MQQLPVTGYLRLSQIIGRRPVTAEQAAQNRAQKKRGRRATDGTPALIPVSASTWWNGVRDGRHPKPVKLGGSTLWRVEDIRALMLEMEHQQKGGAE